jgi:hypothetical protein
MGQSDDAAEPDRPRGGAEGLLKRVPLRPRRLAAAAHIILPQPCTFYMEKRE